MDFDTLASDIAIKLKHMAAFFKHNPGFSNKFIIKNSRKFKNYVTNFELLIILCKVIPTCGRTFFVNGRKLSACVGEMQHSLFVYERARPFMAQTVHLKLKGLF